MKTLAAVLVMLFVSAAVAEGAETEPVAASPLHIERYTARDGLPAESINALLLDRTGLLWIGTREGLFSYDGYAFEAYVHEVGDPNSLVDNSVRTIFEDQTGKLWLGTNTAGLARFDRSTRTFHSYRHDAANAQSLTHDSVYAISDTGDGRLWVGTQAGLNRLDPGRGTIERVPLLGADHPHHGAEYIAALLRDEDGTIWVGTVGDGLLRFNPDTGPAVQVAIDPDPRRGADAFSLALDRTGRIWIGTRFGAYVRDRATGRVTPITSAPGHPTSISETVVPAIASTPSGEVWLGTLSGLYRIDAVPHPSASITIGQDTSGQGRISPISALALTPTGMLWVGTVGEGLHRATPPAGPFRVLAPEHTSSRSGQSDEVTTIYEDSRGQIWYGTFGSGVNRYDPKSRTGQRVLLAANDLNLAAGTLRIEPGQQGELWIGATDGLHRFELASGRARWYRHDPARDDSPRRGYVFAIEVDHQGAVWFGTGGGGLHRVRNDGEGIERIALSSDDPTTLSDDFITVVLEDSRHRIWVGTRSGGLNRFDPATRRAQRIRVDPMDPVALPHHSVTSILEDTNGRIWVGMAGGGLARWTGEDSTRGATFERFTARDGLADDNVMALTEDDDGSLWLSTRRGLTRFDPSRRVGVSYDTADGLPSSEGNVSAAFRGAASLYIGTMNGLVLIPRGTTASRAQPSRLTLTSVRSPHHVPRIVGEIWPPQRVEIDHGEIVSVEFAVADFDPNRRHRYAYRFSARDDSWSDLGSKRELTFADLSPGTHQLEVRGRGARGDWSDPPLRLQLDVIPPFYLTAWFQSLVGLALVGFAYAGHRLRTRALESRNRELTELQVQREAALDQARVKEAELQAAFVRHRQLTRRLEAAKEEERQRIARELHDEMGQLLTAAKINVQLLQRTPTDESAAKRLVDLIGLLDRMIQLVRSLSFELRPPLMEELGLVAALRGHLDALAWRSGLDIQLDTGTIDESIPLEVGVAAFRIVQESLTNTIRHADAKHARIALRAAADRLIVEIRDDGRGFDPSRALHDPHCGLAGMQERAQALGGDLSIRSVAGEGTTILAELPWRG